MPPAAVENLQTTPVERCGANLLDRTGWLNAISPVPLTYVPSDRVILLLAEAASTPLPWAAEGTSRQFMDDGTTAQVVMSQICGGTTDRTVAREKFYFAKRRGRTAVR